MAINQKVLQWKFTACRYNIENANGFKTFSHSEGLSQADKDELVQIAGTYVRPQNLPDRPDEEELKLFPVVLYSVRLRSGKRAIIQTAYVGKDYAGVRWGNFFSHALVLPQGNWEFHPIRLWKSPIFQMGLTQEERNIQTTPDALPILEIQDRHLCDWSASLERFFDDSRRRSILQSLLSAVREWKTSGKSIFLRDVEENIPLWIAALQSAFPVVLSQEIPFVLHLQSLNNPNRFLLNATNQERNEFFFEPNQSSFFWVYDVPAAKTPENRWKKATFSEQVLFQPSFPGSALNQTEAAVQSWDCSLFDDSLERAVDWEDFLTLGKFAEPSQELDFLNEQNLKPQLKAAFAFFAKQSTTRRLDGLRRLFARNVRYASPILETAIPLVARTILDASQTISEADRQKLKFNFEKFLATQFSIPLESLYSVDFFRYFELLDKFCQTPFGRETALELRELIRRRQSSFPSYLLFLETSLILILFPEFADEINWLDAYRFSAITPEEKETFLKSVLPLMIKKCDHWKKHESVVALFPERNQTFFKNYISYLKNDYQTANWQKGLSALPQATAFIDYYLRLQPKKFNQDYATLSEPDAKNHRLLWHIFGVSENMSPKELDQYYEAIFRVLVRDLKINDDENAKKTLKPGLLSKSRPKTSNGGFKRFGLIAVAIAFLIVALIAGILLNVKGTSPSPSEPADVVPRDEPLAPIAKNVVVPSSPPRSPNPSVAFPGSKSPQPVPPNQSFGESPDKLTSQKNDSDSADSTPDSVPANESLDEPSGTPLDKVPGEPSGESPPNPGTNDQEPNVIPTESSAPPEKGSEPSDVLPETTDQADSPSESNLTAGLGTGTEAGELKSIDVQGVEYAFRWIPPGEFIMGSPKDEEGRQNDENQHRVKLTQGFWILETETTKAMYYNILGKTPTFYNSETAKSLPVTVGWEDARQFCEKFSQASGFEAKLPTEAQWEYACRAGTQNSFGKTEKFRSIGWFKENSQSQIKDVKSPIIPPNSWNVYDMHGNVGEWCADWYGDYETNANGDAPSDESVLDPTGAKDGSFRVFRGGTKDDPLEKCRSAYRAKGEPLKKFSSVGFRFIVSPTPTPKKQ